MKGPARVFRISTLLFGLLAAVPALSAEFKAVSSASSRAIATPNLAGLLGLESNSRLVVQRSAPTWHGTTTVRMQQTWANVPIFGQVLTVEEDRHGNVVSVHGDVVTGLAADLSTAATTVRPAQAIATLAMATGTDPARLENSSAQLFVLVEEGRARLAYLTSFFTHIAGQPTRPKAFVDALTGKIVRRWEGLELSGYGGPGGNDKGARYYYAHSHGRWGLSVSRTGATCSLHNSVVKIINLNHATSGGMVHSYTCPDNEAKEINGAGSPMNDAHFQGTLGMNLFKLFAGQYPVPAPLQIGVHYGQGYEGAMWTGGGILLGDGAANYHPYAVPDRIGHEMAHGFIERTSALVYTNQSGAIAEAFADMVGESVEALARQAIGVTDRDLLVGEDLIKSPAIAVRYMCNPRLDGKSIDHASQYRDGMDPHHASGLFNKAFCALTTPHFNTMRPFQIFARANDLYWTPNETFNSAAAKVVRASCDLNFGAADVVAAFKSVGVEPGPVPTGCKLEAPKGEANFPILVAASLDGLTARFHFDSPHPADPSVRYLWDFGDGRFSSETHPVHTYAEPGEYEVKVWGVDADGFGDWTKRDIFVTSDDRFLPPSYPLKLSGAAGSQKFFIMDIPADATDLKFTLSGGTGDADLYVRFGEKPTTSIYDCRSYRNGNEETCLIPHSQGGRYYILVNGYRAYDQATLLGEYDETPDQVTYTNETDFPIADHATIESRVNVMRTGNAGAATKVTVDIQHTYIGDLTVSLIAPDGTPYVLHNRTGGSTDNLSNTYTLDLSGEAASGDWKLRVNDGGQGDTGVLDKWSLTF